MGISQRSKSSKMSKFPFFTCSSSDLKIDNASNPKSIEKSEFPSLFQSTSHFKTMADINFKKVLPAFAALPYNIG